jgi:hypothetical protein
MLQKSIQWVHSCSMRTDGHIERHGEANSRISQFANISKVLCTSSLQYVVMACA